MPRPKKKSVCVVNTSVCQDNSIVSQESSSSDVEMEVQSPQFIQTSTVSHNLLCNPCLCHILKGQKMDWTVNNGLCHRFCKWKMKCENILDCELAMFPNSKKCKNVIVQSGDFGMDHYVSWSFSHADVSLDVIWAMFEDSCKPQTNEMRARFDLLTSFRQGNYSVDECTMLCKPRCPLPSTYQKLQVSCIEIFSSFFLKDEEFVSKTINDSNIDLDKFPASKVRQLSKKMKSSKSTARHLKSVASVPQVAQVNCKKN